MKIKIKKKNLKKMLYTKIKTYLEFNLKKFIFKTNNIFGLFNFLYKFISWSLGPLRDMGLTPLETGPSSQGGYPRYHLTWSPPRRGAPLLSLGSPSGASLPPLFAHHSSVLSFSLQAVTHKLNLAAKVVH